MTVHGKYGPFSPSLLVAMMKERGMVKDGRPDKRALMAAFIQANEDEIRDIRTIGNWISDDGTEPSSSDLGYLSNALECKPEDLLERR